MNFLQLSQWFVDMLEREGIDTVEFPYGAWWYPKHIHTFYWSTNMLSGNARDLDYYLCRGKWR